MAYLPIIFFLLHCACFNLNPISHSVRPNGPTLFDRQNPTKNFLVKIKKNTFSCMMILEILFTSDSFFRQFNVNTKMVYQKI
jgi:hypothetical protein